LEESYKGTLQVTLESQEDLLGTAQALLNLKTKYRTGSQYLVISGDTIVDPSFLHAMIDSHLRDEATVTVALKHKPTVESDPSAQRSIRSGDIIGTDPSSKQLLMIASSDDYVDAPMKIKHSLLDQFHAIQFGYNILDAHCYIFSRYAMDLLERQKHISSIKHEFLPFLLRCQYRPKLAVPPSKSSSKSSSGEDSDQDHRYVAAFADNQTATSSKLVAERSSSNPVAPGVVCRIHMISDSQYCARVNSLTSYIEANRDIATGKEFVKPLEPVIRGAFIAQDVTIGGKSKVTNNCCIGNGTKIGAKATIESSVIGKHCQIGDNVKLVGCVLMDHVIVESGSQLSNSVVCPSAHISSNSTITDCSIGPTFTTEEGAKHHHESLSTISTAL
jgi:translation initiation factor eIF-2B subunit gamma